MASTLPTFVEANTSFEKWLAAQIPIVAVDLDEKHRRMAEAVFPFLRATFFRWIQTYPALCPDLASAPVVLSVGDLHVENFGTWRDADSRLVWGINDFDEAYNLPYTNDLVRLAASACLAIGEKRLKHEPACVSILAGYRQGLESGGNPFLLAEQNQMLLSLAEKQIKNAAKFYKKLKACSPPTDPAPSAAIKLLEDSLPEPGIAYQLLHRQAGLGSLGRQRFVALTSWRGGMPARETKPMVLSACLWASPERTPRELLIKKAIDTAVRCPDAALRFGENWICRRLAPDCVKIEVIDSAEDKDLLSPEELPGLLELMGSETANIHLGTRGARQVILSDLDKRRQLHPKWLYEAVDLMLARVVADWKEWKKSTKP